MSSSSSSWSSSPSRTAWPRLHFLPRLPRRVGFLCEPAGAAISSLETARSTSPSEWLPQALLLAWSTSLTARSPTTATPMLGWLATGSTAAITATTMSEGGTHTGKAVLAPIALSSQHTSATLPTPSGLHCVDSCEEATSTTSAQAVQVLRALCALTHGDWPRDAERSSRHVVCPRSMPAPPDSSWGEPGGSPGREPELELRAVLRTHRAAALFQTLVAHEEQPLRPATRQALRLPCGRRIGRAPSAPERRQASA
eukprot:CAMPEP_0177294250 /NCGR_PEP_ID=MMETSP0368-20130122/1214_1 /TAXON_ID=447022 ORGANISM="Scrippsiella hangoei-like, Strain SHHI-4" /NCGR_SAMPLE_ID=MMETSP0368 /ASSEMBLY_ACC=CAM_ASM_000363 /LENGTH=254 /DNA_ID=CAMNT_0018752147 /DNA_START=411 /DNA_END=1172 /DNA_ORIENTATION=+